MMDAVEFVKTLRRMCNCECRKCKFGKRLSGLETCTVWRKTHPEEAVAIAEKWAAEHPVKTRQNVFLEQWPNAEFDCQGIIAIDPCDVDKTMPLVDGGRRSAGARSAWRVRGMTNFEFYTKNAARLGELIEKAVDDALEAKGCSLDLKYPEKLSNADDARMVTWASWLNEEM